MELLLKIHLVCAVLSIHLCSVIQASDLPLAQAPIRCMFQLTEQKNYDVTTDKGRCDFIEHYLATVNEKLYNKCASYPMERVIVETMTESYRNELIKCKTKSSNSK